MATIELRWADGRKEQLQLPACREPGPKETIRDMKTGKDHHFLRVPPSTNGEHPLVYLEQ